MNCLGCQSVPIYCGILRRASHPALHQEDATPGQCEGFRMDWLWHSDNRYLRK